MLRLAACRAVLSGDLPKALRDSPWVRVSEAKEPEKAVSSAAAYALDAVRDLQLTTEPPPALYSFSGPAGSTLHLFDRAWQTSSDGRLLGAEFPRRSRRIHPFTLLLSLHNQVAATLSLELGLRGPAMNLVDSPASFVDLMPNMAGEVQRGDVVAVFSSATNRAEERARIVSQTGHDRGLEGAIALVFTSTGELGVLAPEKTGGKAMPIGPGLGMPDGDQWPFGPCLEPGLGVVWALTTDTALARFDVGTPRRRAVFSWRAA